MRIMTSIPPHVRLWAGLALLCPAVLSCGGGDGPEIGAINLAPNKIAFTTAPGGALDPKAVGVTPATVNLSGLTVATAYAGNPPGEWLSTSLSKSTATLTEPAILTLEVTNSTLPAGTYTATVTIESPGAANSPRVTVTLTIEAAAALAILTQPSPTAASGTALAQTPVVQFQTADGTPVAQSGVDVSVTIEGGGSLSGPTTVTSDAQGQAAFTGLVVTAPVGEHTLLFSANGLTEVRSTPVAVTVGAATTIAASSATPQSAEAGTPVGDPPAVLVTDGAGNPVEGVAVTFAVTQGGGAILPVAAGPTGPDGVAALDSWTLGPVAGVNAVTASATGLSGSPVQFDATGTNEGVLPGPVDQAKSKITLSPASFAAGSAGTTVTVTARDANNNLIGGATVILMSTGSNFAFQSTTLTTGTNGATLGKATTTYTSTKAEAKSISAQITASGVTVSPTAAGVTVTAGAASAANSTLSAGSPVTGLTNASTVTVTVKDAFGNPVSGRAVALSAGGDPTAVISQPGSSTGGTGQTTGSIKSTTGGNYQVQATVDPLGTPVVITQTASITFLISFATDIKAGILDVSFDLGAAGVTSPCSSCHLPENAQDPDLSFAHITDAHDAGNVVVPGNADNSLLVKALLHDASLQPDELMPSSGQSLPASVIDLIKRWINQNGAGALTP
jgi:Big-like domain-containing protein